MGLLILALMGVIAYLGVVGMVCWKETHVPQTESYDAIVVLGAQVKPDGTPSVQLQWRLDAAFEAWKEKECLIVVCGAQGSDEPDAEGVVVYHLHVAPDDMGRVIGKQGRIAKAIRTVMRAGAVRAEEKISVEID